MSPIHIIYLIELSLDRADVAKKRDGEGRGGKHARRHRELFTWKTVAGDDDGKTTGGTTPANLNAL